MNIYDSIRAWWRQGTNLDRFQGRFLKANIKEILNSDIEDIAEQFADLQVYGCKSLHAVLEGGSNDELEFYLTYAQHHAELESVEELTLEQFEAWLNS